MQEINLENLKQLNGMVVLCYENERPFQGLFGQLDWRFNGHFTSLLKKQILTGKKGEVLYAPLLWNDKTFHFILILVLSFIYFF